MPKGPQGQKRPADVISNAVHVMRIATGEIEEPLTKDGKNAAAVALGRKGGTARAKSLDKRKLTAIARKAAKARWGRAR
jgi:2-keto-3-deoxy-6-phosphogluconate aldolase